MTEPVQNDQIESAPAAPGQSLSVPWYRVSGQIRRLVQTLCAIAPFVLILLGVHPALASIPALYPFYVLLRRTIRRLIKHPFRSGVGGENTLRQLLALLPVMIYPTTGSTGPVGWVAVVLVALLPLTEPVLSRVAPGRKLRVQNLPGIPPSRQARFPLNVVLVADLAIALVAGGLLLLGVPGGAILPLPLLALVLSAVFALDAFQRVRESVHADNDLYAAIAAYAPKFVLYYGVPTGSEYQVRMWMEYLERIGEPFIVILRHRSTFNKIGAMTEAPVVVRNNMRQLDDVVVPSINAAFYVNNGALNVHMVRYPQITHVQLLHGDSDKATSFNPITGMFDKIFVAGQAGIDRYANNGVIIPEEKFEIVGRPQVEAVQPQSAENLPVSTVLYAPTWEGHYADTNYGSLPVGPAIVRELLARGITVVFRPHPYSYRNPEAEGKIREIHQMLEADAASSARQHLWGAPAEKDLDAFGCFNAADAMISDVSSVVPDFLYSGKPYALVTMTSTVEDFEQEFPLAGSAYVIDKELTRLGSALDDLLMHDTKAQQRMATREYYLGPFPPENYAEAFIGAAREFAQYPHSLAMALASPAEGEEGTGEVDEVVGGASTPDAGPDLEEDQENDADE